MMRKLLSISYLLAAIIGSNAATAQDHGTLLQVVNKASTLLSLSANGVSGQNILTLQAQVVGVQGHIPTGSVSFSATNSQGQTSSSTVLLDAQGKAAWTANAGLGTYNLAASYTGDSNYLQSQVSQQNFATPDFSLNIPNNTVTVKQGESWNGAATLTSLNGFAGTVTVQCGEMPEQVNCGLGSNSVQVANGAQLTDAVTVGTVGTTVTTVSGLMLVSSFAFSRRRRRWAWLSTSCGLALALVSLTGCGVNTKYLQSNGTPRGTYKLSITAVSGVITHTQTVTLTVQ
jgi:Bacterial Ig-like domain (group 3)